MGPDTIGGYVDDVIDLAAAVAASIDAEPAVEVAAPPSLSTIVFRYRPPRVSEDEADLLTPRIRSTLYERGNAMVAATKVDGRCWLKLTLLNPMATPDQILGIIREVVAIGDEIAPERAVVR
jgi:L-2,4-diaminobutyrate decarboxylase